MKFRNLRILILLLVLLFVAVNAWRGKARVTSWERTIYVALYPIAADATPETASFIRALKTEDFAPIEHWLQQEAERYGKTLKPVVRIHLAPQVRVQPPQRPTGSGILSAVLWSLKLRWWAYRHDDLGASSRIAAPQVRLFALFHAARPGLSLPHSTGLKEGQIGVVHVFADAEQHGPNAVVMAHELLHTFGATDKYDPATLQPDFPDGYADPGKVPPLPQSEAEIMAGRIPKTPAQADMPQSLDETRIGVLTAAEIGLH